MGDFDEKHQRDEHGRFSSGGVEAFVAKHTGLKAIQQSQVYLDAKAKANALINKRTGDSKVDLRPTALTTEELRKAAQAHREIAEAHDSVAKMTGGKDSAGLFHAQVARIHTRSANGYAKAADDLEKKS